jgi:ribosome-binding factor A
MISKFVWIGGLLLSLALSTTVAFSVNSMPKKTVAPQKTQLFAYHYSTNGRSSPRSGKERSKRQDRVGHVVRTELARILHTGLIKGDSDYLDDELRKRISVVSADVSPDMRQARITVSVRASKDPENTPAVDKRRAYSWLVSNTKPLRHSLAQKMSHMKSCPSLSFAQVDVAAAVDVMYLIDKVAEGYKRSKIGDYGENDDSMPKGYIADMDFDEEFDEEEWDEEDDFFDSKE